MKTIKLFAIAAACIALFASCTKTGEQKEDYSAIQKQLIGTWEGVNKTTATLNGKEIDMGSTTVVLTFTEKTLTRKDGEGPATTYDYVIKKNDGKYLFSCSYKGEEIGAVWFEISGNTLSIVGGDGTFAMTFPKTLTQK